jgi:hypothetical protein
MCRLRHPALDVSLSTCVRLWISAYAGSSDRHASSALLAASEPEPEPVMCSRLYGPNQMGVTFDHNGTGNLPVGTVATYSMVCGGLTRIEAGSGTRLRTCQADGTWSGCAPNCRLCWYPFCSGRRWSGCSQPDCWHQSTQQQTQYNLDCCSCYCNPNDSRFTGTSSVDPRSGQRYATSNRAMTPTA